MTNSSKRVLFLASSAAALAFTIAPASFAGESDGTPGPTQVGTIQGPAGPQGPAGAIGPAGPQGPAGPAGPAGPQGSTGANGANGATGDTGATGATGATGPAGANGKNGVSQVLAASHTSSSSSKSSSSKSKGGVLGASTTITTSGIQAGFGGMATESASRSTLLASVGGILLVLASAFGLTPIRRRSQD
jgi:hypothetical protein